MTEAPTFNCPRGSNVQQYGKIFINTSLARDELIAIMARIVDGQITRRTIEGAGLIIDVIKNEDFNQELAVRGTDEFIRFPFYLDVEPQHSGMPDSAFKEAIRRLLSGLREAGLMFVTAADFEDELPDHGSSPARGG